jgi:hypothetical protein
MVDYDTAVAAVQDPNADPILLAKIAYENPEFGANVVVNPRCYPGLKRWLAEFGDGRARETLTQYGFTADSIGGPVQDQEAPAQAMQPMASQAPADPYAGQQAAGAYGQSAADPYAAQYAQPTDAAYAQPAADPYAAQPAAQGAQDAQPSGQDISWPSFDEQPAATNQYGYTADQALNTTDQMQIAQIAQYAPELRACLARNPNTYPALLDWLGQLGDPAINAAIASRQ